MSVLGEPLRLECGDADLVSSLSILSGLNECDVGKASGSKSGLQCGGIERYVRVVDVGLPNPLSVKGVRRHETAAGSQYSVQFAKQLILRRFRWHVVEHREAGGGREAIVWQWQLGAVTPDDFDIGTGEADSQVGCKIGVELNCRDGRHALAQKVGGQTWTRSDLQHVIAQLDGRCKPRQQIGLQAVGPFGAGEILKMGSVHALLVPSTGGRVRSTGPICRLRGQPGHEDGAFAFALADRLSGIVRRPGHGHHAHATGTYGGAASATMTRLQNPRQAAEPVTTAKRGRWSWATVRHG